MGELTLYSDDKWRNGQYTLSHDPPDPPPPPGLPYPMLGVTAHDGSLAVSGYANYAAAVQDFEAKSGGLVIYRAFSSSSIGNWTSGKIGDIRTHSDASVHWSFKSWNESEILAWMNGKPDDGKTALLTFQHEPENTSKATGSDLAAREEWRTRQNRLMELKNQVGRSDILCGPIFMMWYTLQNWDWWGQWYVGPEIPGKTPVDHPETLREEWDFIGWDPYNLGHLANPQVYRDPGTEMIDRGGVGSSLSLLDINRATGRPAAIGEWGTTLMGWDTANPPTGHTGWTQAYAEKLLDFCDEPNSPGVISACYWSDQGTVDYTVNTKPYWFDTMDPYHAASRTYWGTGA